MIATIKTLPTDLQPSFAISLRYSGVESKAQKYAGFPAFATCHGQQPSISTVMDQFRNVRTRINKPSDTIPWLVPFTSFGTQQGRTSWMPCSSPLTQCQTAAGLSPAEHSQKGH